MINEEQNKRIENVENIVIGIYNKIMGKKVIYSLPKKSSLYATINHNYKPIEMGFSNNKIPPKKTFKKWAKILYCYKNDTQKYFFFVPPDMVENIKQVSEDKYFKVTKEEMIFYKRKDGNGWTEFPPLSDESLGKFYRLTIKLTPETKVKFGRLYDYALIVKGILCSVFVQMCINIVVILLKE